MTEAMMVLRRTAMMLVLAATVAAAGACGDDDPPDAAPPTSTPQTPEPLPSADDWEPVPCPEFEVDPEADVAEPRLRTELIEMQDADQAERSGESPLSGDRERTERLADIIDEYGWPTTDMVGVDGAFAAWLIAQHSDLDVDFQRRALDLMQTAAADCKADPSNVAYLVDRVAANLEQPQTFGTQVGCADGVPSPAPPIADEANVDQRRASVDLPPLADYYAEVAEACAAES